MLPFNSTTFDGNRGAALGAAVPPPRFRSIVGSVRDARVNYTPTTIRKARADTAAKEAGLRYEEKVFRKLKEMYGWRVLISPPVHFVDDSGHRTCIPDAVIEREKEVYLVEVKSQHMPEAWWQLEKLYRPVFEALQFPKRLVRCVEVVRSCDPAMPFPIRPTLVDDLESWVEKGRSEFGVLVWRL